MSIIYCHACNRRIDTDYDTDHEYECEHSDCNHEEDEECPNSG